MSHSGTAQPGPQQSDGPRWGWIITLTLVVISLLFLTVTAVGEVKVPHDGAISPGGNRPANDPLETICASDRS